MDLAPSAPRDLINQKAPPLLLGAAAALLFTLMALPPLVLVIRALLALPTSSMLGAGIVLDALLLSLTTTTVSTLIIITGGTPLAYVFARCRFPAKRLLSTLIELPIVLPPVVAGLALLMAFGRQGLLGPLFSLAGFSISFSTLAVVMAQVFVAAPFFVRTLQGRFSAIPTELQDAARMDGASGWQSFWRISIPLSLNAFVAGAILSWARALGEFGATILFAGNLRGVTQTMPLLVYGALERDINAALLTAVILILLALAALLLVRWLTRQFDDETDPLAAL